jgi:hypothetical protein
VRKTALVLAAALVLAIAAWTTAMRAPSGSRSQPGGHDPGSAPASARSEPALASEPLAGAGITAPRADLPSIALQPAQPPGAGAYELPGKLGDALARYRAAGDPEHREDALLDLALSDAPDVLRFLLDELRAAPPAEHAPLLYALQQYGSRDAIPELQRLAAQPALTQAQRRALLESADYLALPTYTEFRRARDRR